MNSKKNELNELLINQLHKYEDDIFFGDELRDLSFRLNNLYSSIVVIGQFSVGKSALLNALLGEELLSTRRIESTKVLTRIRFCDPSIKKSVTLHFKDGSEENFLFKNIASLEKYTTFQGAEDTDKLKYVDVYWPLPFLNEHLMLVDTPGANSITKSAFNVTEEALKDASAVVFLFNGQKGMDLTDYSLLTALIDKKKHVFIVATHVDNLTDSDWQLVETSVCEKLAEHVPELYLTKIYPVSSVKGLQGKKKENKHLLNESGLTELENDLFSYMKQREYEHSKLNSIEHDLHLLLNEISKSEEIFQVENETIQAEKQQRLQRLILLTSQEYQSVLLYGEQLLRKRIQKLNYYLVSSDETLHDIKIEMKTGVQNDFKIFRDEVMKNLQNPVLNSIGLESSFDFYENKSKDLYDTWQQKVSALAKEFQEHLLLVTNKDDAHFLYLLENLDANIAISWKDFKQKLMSLQLKNINLQVEKESIYLYKQEQIEIKREYKKVEFKKKRILKEISMKVQNYEKEFVYLRENEKKKLEQLGIIPKIEYYTDTRRKLLIFKDKFLREDDSKRRTWKENVEKLNEEYKMLFQQHKIKQNEIKQDEKEKKRDMEEAFERVEEREEELHFRFMEIILNTLNNNSEQTLNTYREMEEDVEAGWELYKNHHLQQLEKHIDKISEIFKDFVLKAEEKQISKLKVN